MKVDYKKIEEANIQTKPTDVKGKGYIEVNQRVKAFRMVYPTGFINTEMVSNENGIAVFRAECGYFEDEKPYVIATGTAYEKENANFINKTSYIENCETSAVGRALGMAGFGIDASIASKEEVENAKANQNTKTNEVSGEKITEGQIATIKKRYKGVNMTRLLEAQGIERLEDMSLESASRIVTELFKRDKEKEAKNGTDNQ